MMLTYSIGIDFGTLSARAVLLCLSTKREVFTCVSTYPHAVIENKFLDGKALPKDTALQHPADYLYCLKDCIKQIFDFNDIKPDEICGIGIDFTGSTVLAVDISGNALAMCDKFSSAIHAYAKLWKDHSSQMYADKINLLAKKTCQPWLKYYGGKVNSEWLFPKLLQIYEEAYEVFENMYAFVEAGDYIVWQLTGRKSANLDAAGFKALWTEEYGYPSEDFLNSLSSGFSSALSKLNGKIIHTGENAGFVCEKAAKEYGLSTKTAVSASILDAHAAVCAVGANRSGDMLIVLGTSNSHMLIDKSLNFADGICGVVKDGFMRGFYSYESGQCCVGDCFQWFIDNCVPKSYFDRANEKNLSIFEYLTSLAENLKAGESGLVALDWWNGNRSILADSSLSGLILGMTLNTKPEHIFRAIIEATAFGTKLIIENFNQNNITVNRLFAGGGIAEKNSFILQIYSDILGMEINLCASSQSGALGSAIYGALAAKNQVLTYEDILKASEEYSLPPKNIFKPNIENTKVYNELYKIYLKLHDFFGKDERGIMSALKNLQ